MAASNIADDIVLKAKSAVEAAELTVEGLRSASMQQLRELKVPLAARHFLQTAGYCAVDADQQQRDKEPQCQSSEVGHAQKMNEEKQHQENDAGVRDDELENSLASSFHNSCSCTRARKDDDAVMASSMSSLSIQGGPDDAVMASVSSMRIQGDPERVAVLPAERGGIAVGGRFDVHFDDAVWYSATVMHADGSGNGILLFDSDQSLGFLSERMLTEDKEVRYSFVPAPQHKHSLLIAVLQCQDDDWHWLFLRFLVSKGGTGKRANSKLGWTLQILKQLSDRISETIATRRSRLTFTGKMLGRGGFGIVVETTEGAMKMEIAEGSPSVLVQPLWRDYCLCSIGPDSSSQSDAGNSDAGKKRRSAKKHVPRLVTLFDNKYFAQIYEKEYEEDAPEYTISLLGMEKLDAGPKHILEEAAKVYEVEHRVPDSARLLALNMLYCLEKLKEAGIAHCDLKIDHFMHRQERNGTNPTKVLVVIDGGLSRIAPNNYAARVPCKGAARLDGRFVTASVAVPMNRGQLQVIPIIGDPKWTGTPGFRAPRGAADKSILELFANDVFGCGIVLLSAVGLKPGLTVREAEKFESQLYAVLEQRSFERFLELCPGYRAGEKDGGLDCTTIRWFQLCFEMLNLDFAQRMTPAQALRSSMLLHPNYEQKLFEQLRGEGVVVFDRTGVEPALNPLLLLYSPDHGILVFRLLNCKDKEAIARYGGQLLQGEIGVAEHGLHNLSIGSDSVLFGSVSEFHSMESFIQNCCVGSFIESSRTHPDTNIAGNCYNVDRLGQIYQLTCDQGSSSIMSCITMLSKRAEHSTRCSWSYSFNAGSGLHLLSPTELQKKQDAFARPTPTHFPAVLAKQRVYVKGLGFTDSWTDSDDSDLREAADTPGSMSQGAGLQPESESQGSLPLPKGIVELLEAADSVKFARFSWSDVMDDAPVLTQADLEAAGIPVLPDIPKSKSEFEKAAKGQRAVMMDGTSTAIEAAKTLKQWINSDGDLYSRVCGPSPAEKKKQTAGAGGAGGAGRSRRRPPVQAPPAQTFGKKAPEDKREPLVPCILRVIYAYCMGCRPSFKGIFQNLPGNPDDSTEGDRRRRECKADEWPHPVMKSGESKESFLDRMAGYKFLLKFYELIFYKLVGVLPKKAKVNSSFCLNKCSLIFSDAKQGVVQRQDVHSDMAPINEELAYSLLMNLSVMLGYIGLVLNSGQNIDSALKFEAKECGGKESFNGTAHLNGRFRNRYLITKSASSPERLLSEVMLEKGFKEEDVLRHAWSLYLQAHAADHPERFKKMRGVWAQISPLMLFAFEDRVLHCGPPFPMPFQNLEDLAALEHFRSGNPAP